MKEIDRKEKGITLVALVVTIIVLLILAGIAISLSIGNNGLFSRAGSAANTWRKAEANEQEEMRKFEGLYDNTLKEIGLEENEDEDIEFTLNGTPYTVKNGTTWNDFFSENFPNDTTWIYLSERGGDNVGIICMFLGDASDGHASFSYLRNELEEPEYESNKIKKENYNADYREDIIIYTTNDYYVFGTKKS